MAKVIKLTGNDNVTLLPITDSAYVQHKWREGLDGGTTITSVQDALNNVIDRVDAWDPVDDDHAYHKVSGTSGKMDDTSSTAATDPYLNVHINTTAASGASAVRFKGSGTSVTGQQTAYVKVEGKASDSTITIGVSYMDNDHAYHKVSGTKGKMSDTSTTAASNPYINVHTNTSAASGASAIQLKGSSSSGAGSASVSVSGVPNTGVITITASYTDTNNYPTITNKPSASSGYKVFTLTDHGSGSTAGDYYISYASDTQGGVVIVDSSLSSTSTNPVQNKAVQAKFTELENTISSGMHMRGTTTTIPQTSVAYTIGDSYVWNSTTTGTLPAGQAQSGATETLSKGDMITYVGNSNWSVIQNNLTLSFENSVIPANGTTTQYVHYNGINYTLKHGTPTANANSKLSKDASGGSALAANTALQVVTGVDISRDANGHVTDLSLDSKSITIPSITTTKTGSGNVVTYVSASGHALTYYMGITALTAHQDHTFTNRAEAASGNYELKLSKGSSGSGSSVYFTPANGAKLTTTGNNTLKIGGTSVNVIKTVSYTSGMYAVIGKDTDINDTWLSTALGTTSGTTYMVNGVTSTNESVWDYT